MSKHASAWMIGAMALLAVVLCFLRIEYISRDLHFCVGIKNGAAFWSQIHKAHAGSPLEIMRFLNLNPQARWVVSWERWPGSSLATAFLPHMGYGIYTDRDIHPDHPLGRIGMTLIYNDYLLPLVSPLLIIMVIILTRLYFSGRMGADDLGPRCRSCGYSLRGISGKRCPECGSESLGIQYFLHHHRK